MADAVNAGTPTTGERDARRVAVDAFVKVAGKDREYVFRTRDLSRSGLFLYTRVARSYPFKVGSTLELELYDYDQHVTCKVVVVRIVAEGSGESEKFPAGFGVRIVDLDDASRKALADMIARAKSGAIY